MSQEALTSTHGISEWRPRLVDVADSASEPPVVARLVVEIRSDGTTTIARAAVCDELNKEGSVLEARGATPLALALSVARHLFGLTRPLWYRSLRPPADRESAR